MKINILKAAFFTPLADGYWGLPLILWSLPGEAKSASVKLLAKMFGNIPVKVLPPGQMAEGAFGVTPTPEKDEETGETFLAFPKPKWSKMFDKDTVGIVFPDETNTAPPALQPAIMGLTLDRRCGDYELPKRVRVFCAGNPTAISAGGWDLPAPVANRLGHIDWAGPTVDEWSDWLLGGTDGYNGETIDVTKEEERVLKAWPAAFAKASATVASFLRRKQDLRHKMPNEGDPQLSRAWPSPRSWESAARALASADVHRLSDVETDELFRAFVGQSAATEFAAWKSALDLPDPSDVLDGKVKFTHDPKRLDRSFVVLSSCASLVAPATAEKRKDRTVALWKILSEVVQKAADVTVPAVRVLCGKTVRLAGFSEARPVLIKLQPMLAAAGINAGAE